MRQGFLKKAVFILTVMVAVLAGSVAVYAEERYGDFEGRISHDIVYDDDKIDITEYFGHDKNLVIPESIEGKRVNSISIGNKNEKQESVSSITILSSGKTIWNVSIRNFTNLTSITIPEDVVDIGFYNCSSLTSITIPSSVKTIGSKAFYNCSSLTSITIPSSVTSIGSNAFESCSSLKDITIPSSVTSIGSNAFESCSSLKDITIPSSVKTIGSKAFYNCSSLTSITIPSSVTSIGSNAFESCSSLKDITIPSSVTSIGSNAFESCSSLKDITIPSSVKTIGSKAFYNCSSLTSITIPEKVSRIGEGVFYNCSSLTSITIPEKVSWIGEGVFYNCSSLTSITIPEYVSSIEKSTFSGCSNLKSIAIPKKVTSIGFNAFENCSSLKNITIPSSVKTIDSKAFYNCSSLTSITIPSGVTSIGSNIFENCDSLKNIIIPSSVKTIDYKAFYNCSSLTSITIPSSVKTIGTNAFENCSSLKNITIPSGVTSIGSNTFENCSSLTSITIPSSVTSIGSNAFESCSSLTSITIPSSVKTIGTNAFYNCSSLTSITIPENVTRIGKDSFVGCGGIKKVDNKSGCYLDLTSLSNKRWTELNSDIPIYSIKNGVAIREDYYTETSIDELILNFLPEKIKGTRMTVSGPVLELAGHEFDTFKTDFDVEIPIPVKECSYECNLKNNNLKVQFGVKLDEGSKVIPLGDIPDPNRKWNKSFMEMKSFYEGLKTGKRDLLYHYRSLFTRIKKSPGSVGVDGDIKVCGYLDLQIAKDENGEWIISKLNEGGIMVIAEADVKYTTYPFPPPFTVVYLQAELSGKEKSYLSLKSAGAKIIDVTGVSWDLKPEIGLSGAVGAGAEVIDLYAKGGIKGTVKADINILPETKVKTVGASIEAFLKWCVFNIPGITGEKSWTGFEWELYPERKMTKNILGDSPKFNKPEVLTSRGTAQILKNSPDDINTSDAIYDFSGIRIKEIGDGKILLTYLDDSVEGAEGKIKLMSRYYNGSEWSAPIMVNNGSFLDSNGEISVVDGNAYVIYQGTESMVNDGDEFDDVVEKMALYVAKFNGSGFDVAIKIGPTGKSRYSYFVSKEYGELQAVWAENEIESLDGNHGDTTIYRCSLNGEAVPYHIKTFDGEKGKVALNDKYGDINYIKYVYYDGSATVNINGTELDTSEYGPGVYSASFDGDKVYLLIGNKLYSYDGEIHDEYASCSSRYRVCGDYVYYTVQNGFSSELYREKLGYEDESPVMITEDGGYITAFDLIPGAEPSDDRVAYGFQTADGDISNPYGLCTIKYMGDTIRHSASLQSDGYDVVDFEPGKENAVYLSVANTGTETLNNVRVKVSIGGVSVYDEMEVSELQPGELKELELSIVFPEDYDASDVVFSLEADEDLDKEVSQTTTYDFSQIDLSALSSNSENAIVLNDSPVKANGVVIKLYDSYEEDDRVIRTVNAGSLEARTEFSETITKADWKKVTRDEASGVKSMVIGVYSSDEEYALGNNSVIVTSLAVDDDDNGGGNGGGDEPGHTHTLTKYDRVEATETEAGNIEYWECSECHQCFSDSEGKTKITKKSTVIPAKGSGGGDEPGHIHTLIKHDRVEATETEAGNIEYWECSECHQCFSDSEEKTKITKKSTVIPAKGSGGGDEPGHIHTLIKHDRVEATETEAGNIEYWECTDCHKCFSDAEGKTEITEESTVIPAKGSGGGNGEGSGGGDDPAHTHTMIKHDRVEATETAAGNIEYWECSECHKCFSDAEGKTEITKESTVISAKGSGGGKGEGSGGGDDPAHTHSLIKHDRIEATETEAGNTEYWECSECHKYFSDAEGKKEITKESTIISAKGSGGEDPDNKDSGNKDSGNDDPGNKDPGNKDAGNTDPSTPGDSGNPGAGSDKNDITDPYSPVHENDGSSAAAGSVSSRNAQWTFDLEKSNTVVVVKQVDIGKKLEAYFTKAEGYDPSAKHRYAVDDKKTAKIDKNGVLKPKKRGILNIRMEQKIKGGGWTSVGEPVRIYIQLPEMQKKDSQSLSEGASLDAFKYLGGTTYRPTKWVSSKPAVASVDPDTGVITVHKKGSAKIIAEYGEGKNGSGKRYATKLKITIGS